LVVVVGVGVGVGVDKVEGAAGVASWANTGAANATVARVATEASNRRMNFSWAAGGRGRCDLD
jgi:hypothetical protein